MGLASSIGVGVALGHPERRIIVFDGDGNILMNMGSLVVIGALRLRNLYHIVLDNLYTFLFIYYSKYLSSFTTISIYRDPLTSQLIG